MINATSVDAAAERLKGIAHRTSVLHSRALDGRAGRAVYLKMESFQRSGSFKFRGAYNALVCSLDEARARGVITGSSGNHGGALALAAQMLGVGATVVMPEDAASVKVAAIRGAGADVVFCGRSSEERLTRAAELASSKGFLMIPPYDHDDIMAGQGTCALEALEQVPEAGIFLAPCGGGGLLAGCAAWISDARPDVDVFGVEVDVADDTRRSFESGHRIKIPLPETLADGIRNVIPGERTFPIVQRACRGIVTVTDEEIMETVAFLALRMKVVVEPTGAVAPAALLHRKIPVDDRSAVALVSGGNVDPKVFARCLGL